jgi:hypothetical protein
MVSFYPLHTLEVQGQKRSGEMFCFFFPGIISECFNSQQIPGNNYNIQITGSEMTNEFHKIFSNA